MPFKNTKILAALAASAFLVTGCGGGGGNPGASIYNNGASGNTTTNGSIVVTPSSADLTLVEGAISVGGKDEDRRFEVKVKVPDYIKDAINIFVVDSNGVIERADNLLSNADHEYGLAIFVKKDLPIGESSTTLEIRVCYDRDITCNKPLPGSPAKFPVKVTKKPAPTAP